MNFDQKWMEKYELLKAYHEEYGNIDVPTNYEKDGIKLGQWLVYQRLAYTGKGNCKITEDRIKLLEKLGMNWNLYDKKWADYYQLLTEYQEEHGNIDVPFSYEKNGMKLGKWLVTQRNAYKGIGTYKRTEKRIKLLENLGINWQIYDKTWNDYYELLKEYQEAHGNINVPRSYEKDGINLGIWLSTQRQAYKGNSQSKLTKDQIKLLNELGIDWGIHHTKILQKPIDEQTKEKYQQVLLERVNHIIDDLVCEGISDINATNQKEIEKIMIKRIWR